MDEGNDAGKKAGKLIDSALEELYRKGDDLRNANKRMFGVTRKSSFFFKYTDCRRRLQNGDYDQDDINFAHELIIMGIKEYGFRAEAGLREATYLKKQLKDQGKK